MKKSTYEVVKMAVLMGVEYRNATHDLEHTPVDFSLKVEPRSQKPKDVINATTENLNSFHESRLNHRDAVADVEVAKAKINTLLWFVSEDEYIEDADI